MAIFLPKFIEDMQAEDGEEGGSMFAGGGDPGEPGETCTLCGHGEYVGGCDGEYATSDAQCNACGHSPY
jgi:hypothetical protein